MLIATMLATKQTMPASRTSRKSCSPVRQVKARNMPMRNGYSADEYSDLIFYLANISQLSIACLLGRENGLPRVITLLRDATSADISPHQSSGCATLAREFTDR
jgi:hypothetical protein